VKNAVCLLAVPFLEGGIVMSWPKAGDRPFQGKGDPNLLAIIRWQGPEGQWLFTEENYATAFKVAADLIVDALAVPSIPSLGPVATGGDYPSNADHYFFPVAYLYRHCIELQLKALIRAAVSAGVVSDPGQSLYRKDDLYGSHHLDELWTKAREALLARWAGAPGEPLDAAETVILDFDELDKCGQEFRYPHRKDGKKHLSSAPPAVNLEHLKEVVDGVHQFLGAANSFES
jgi:hypothetical protein